MTEQEKFNCYCKKHGYNHKTFFNRPHWTRRGFFQMAGAGVTATFLAQKYAKAQTSVVTNSGAVTKNTATNVIFILLAGAPSHTDTFDLKVINGVTPATFAPETVNGIMFPTGLFPNLTTHIQDFALIRSMQSDRKSVV